MHRIRFADSDQATHYLTEPLSDEDGRAFLRGVEAGELVPVSALGDPSATDRVQLPIAVDPNQVPPSVGAGDLVDVYILRPGSSPANAATPALEAASVVSAPDPADRVVASGERQLVLAVPGRAAREFLAAFGSDDQAALTVVRRP
jgi:hypothetical protein